MASATKRWTYPISGIDCSPVYQNGIIYAGGTPGPNLSNHLYALDANSGKLIWDFAPGISAGHIAISNDTIFVGGNNNVFFALNTSNGNIFWQFAEGYDGAFFGTPVYNNGNIIAANASGYLYSLNSATGTVNWKTYIFPDRCPSVVNNIIYTTGTDSTLENEYIYAINAVTGNVIWKSFIYEPYGFPLVASGNVYEGDVANNLKVFDALSGQFLWKGNQGGWKYYAQMVNNAIYSSGDFVVRSLDGSTGNQIWTLEFPQNTVPQRAGVVVANGTVYFGDNTGLFQAVDATNGNPQWTFHIGTGYIASSPCIVDSSGNSFTGAY